MTKLVRRAFLLGLIAALAWFAERSVYRIPADQLGKLELSGGRVILLHSGFSFIPFGIRDHQLSLSAEKREGTTIQRISVPLSGLENIDDLRSRVCLSMDVKYAINPVSFALQRNTSITQIVANEIQTGSTPLLEKIVSRSSVYGYSIYSLMKAWNAEREVFIDSLKGYLASKGIDVVVISLGDLQVPSETVYYESRKRSSVLAGLAIRREEQMLQLEAEHIRAKNKLIELSEELEIISAALKKNPDLIRYLTAKQKDSPVGQNPAFPANLWDLGMKNSERKDIDNFRE